MKTDLTLCVLFNLLNRNPTKPTFNYSRTPETQQHETAAINIHINYITQNGNANIAGTGTVQYIKIREDKALIERLEKENKLLCELVEMLRLRDK